MMIRFLLALVLIAGGMPFLSAQVPGYEGKRWLASADIYLFPATRAWIFEEGKLGLNVHAQLEGEYVLSRRLSVGLMTGAASSTFPYNYLDTEGRAFMQVLTVGAHARMYRFLRKGNIAPVGPYQKIGLQYIRYQTYDPNQLFPVNGTLPYRSGDWVISFGLGTQQIIRDRLIYHFGLDAGWILNLFEPEGLSEAETYIRQESISRLRGVFGINLQAGIGLLLY